MKIAVATQEGGLKDQVSGIVGRAPTFTVVETSQEEIIESKVLQNEFSQVASGAGVQAAQMLVNEGIEAIIGGNFGPNLARVFTESRTKMYQASGMTVEQADRSLLNDDHTRAKGATGQPGRGKGRGSGRRQPGGGQGGGMGGGRGSSRRQ